MNRILAQIPIGTINGIGPLGNTASSNIQATNLFAKTISNLIGIMTIVGGIWFVFQMFQGAFAWMSSGGDKQGVQTAQKKITNAILGLFITVASYAIILTVGRLFGLDIVNIGGSILKLTP